MKSIYFFGLLIAFALVFSSCSIEGLEASTDITVEERPVETFHAIKVSNDIELVINKGNQQFVEVTTSRNIQEHVKTTVKNGTLFVNLDKYVKELKELRVFIIIPEITKITLVADCFGNVSGFENMESFSVNLSSDSYLLLSGSSKNLSLNISSDARVEAYGFETQNCNINCSSDASASITCFNTLNGSISSDASVFYKGTPIINVQTSSDGVLINAN